MKLIIDIPEEEYIKICDEPCTELALAVRNGTPLEKVTSEIDQQEKWLLQAGYTTYNVDIAFDAIKAVLAEMR